MDERICGAAVAVSAYEEERQGFSRTGYWVNPRY